MKAQKIITSSLIVTTIIVTLNSLYKYNKWPAFRTYFGTGVLWLFLATGAEYEPELAQSFAIAVATFVVLGEGGGVFDHFMGNNAANTIADTTPKQSVGTYSGGQPTGAVVSRRTHAKNAVSSVKGTSPVKPYTI